MAKLGRKFREYSNDIREMIINENTSNVIGARCLASKSFIDN